MERFVIEGGRRLSGEVEISGAKNSALPIIAASLLTDKEVVLENVPDLVDVHTMLQLIRYLGARVSFKKNILKIDPKNINRFDTPYDIVRRMRASYYVLGALIARRGKARVSLPGGCAIGPRPIDLHIKGLRKLGAKIEIEKGYINATARHLRGKEINIQGPKGTSVGATINIILAATNANHETLISPAACEPEVCDTVNFLKKMGAEISGEGTPTIRIKGRKNLSGCRYRIIPDRIEAGTFALAGAITKGSVSIVSANPAHLKSVMDKLLEVGAECNEFDNGFQVRAQKRLSATNIFVAPYPGFPTDQQAQFMALLSMANGTSTIKETIFENRFMQAVELMRMGADITIEGDTAVISGVKRLSGAYVMASDLRASAALVLAGLAAVGRTVVRRIYHLDRGYEKFEVKLRRLGAKIRREKE